MPKTKEIKTKKGIKEKKAAPKARKTEKKQIGKASSKKVVDTGKKQVGKASSKKVVDTEKKQVGKVSSKKVIDKEVKYYEAVGRRKTAVARVRLFTKGNKEFLVNDQSCKDYFPTFELQHVASASLEKMKNLDRFKISARVKGGGTHAQAEAVRHGIARVLVSFNSSFRKRLKKAGHLTRDPRMRERKKFGLKRARRAPQWRKR